MHRLLLSTCLALILAGCHSNGSGQPSDESEAASDPATGATPTPAIIADAMASHDPGPGHAADPAQADDQPRPVMKAQVLLDRQGFSPGVVDGQMGLSTVNALKGFQQANALDPTGALDDATMTVLSRWGQIAATRLVTIPADFAAGPFVPVPKDLVAQGKLPTLGYAALDEKLAERFHTTVATLRALNGALKGSVDANAPQPPFAAGQRIRVPNVGADAINAAGIGDAGWLRTLVMLGVGTDQPALDRIVVSRSRGTLTGYDTDGKVVALFTVTTGSSHDPLPLGQWKITVIDRNPKFHYNPELFWDVSDARPKVLLPPGPNGPVGVVWIDLSKEHYGIHGTPEPETIGRSESHGCVRLTNWDAARLAQMVSTATRVEFVA